MATSLYDLSVPTFLQTVRGVAGFLDRTVAHWAANGADPDALWTHASSTICCRIHLQIEALVNHAVWVWRRW